LKQNKKLQNIFLYLFSLYNCTCVKLLTKLEFSHLNNEFNHLDCEAAT